MSTRVGSIGVVGFLLFVAPLAQGAAAAQDPGAPPGLRPALKAALAPQEYALVPDVPAAAGRPRWTAENPAQGLWATFDDAGVRIGREGAPEAPSLLTLQLVRWGWTGALAAPDPPEIVTDGARLEYRRGAITEWYVNAEAGLEQGFTIEEPPAQGAEGGVLELCLALGATHAPRIDEDRRGLTLVDARGERGLGYSGLVAWDANGRELAVWLEERQAGGVAILVRAEGVVWPIVVDPLIAVQEAKLTAADPASWDLFGWSVSMSGDTALIGADLDDHAGGTDAGSAYVFVRTGTTWTQQAKLIAADAASDDLFGDSVSLSGDTALVGARLDDHAGGTNAGSAYVFVRSGTTWTQQAKLVAGDAAGSDSFGCSVFLSGDTALVGAQRDDHAGGADAGSAYVFVRSGTTWTEQAKLIAGDAAIDDEFGCSVSLSGSTALVGAYLDDHPGGTDAGSAYVFVRSGTTWTIQDKLTASDAADGDEFGRSVSLSGETALVGAYADDHAGGTEAGSAYLFARVGTWWNQKAKLTAADAAGGDQFGASVSLCGDTALVGARYDDHTGATDAGSAYVFVLSGFAWTQQAKLTAADPAGSNWLGASVSLSGETALVGAAGFSQPGVSVVGSAYVFRLTTCGTATAYGAGCAGSGGFVPALALSGCPAPNQTVQLSLTQGLGGSLALFLFGAGQGSVPIGGDCTFLLNPVLPLQFILPLGGSGPGNGSILLPGVLPASAAGLTFTMQAAVADAASPLGFSLTNGVLAQVAP